MCHPQEEETMKNNMCHPQEETVKNTSKTQTIVCSVAVLATLVVAAILVFGSSSSSHLRHKSIPFCSTDDFACDLPEGSMGVSVCRRGLSLCLDSSEQRTDDTCGPCSSMPVEVFMTEEEETRGEPIVLEGLSRVCSSWQLMKFICLLQDGSEGVMVCQDGVSKCNPWREVDEDVTCGCCGCDGASN
jgi:hypothetical protein